MSICYDPMNGNALNPTTSCPKRPILPQGVLNPDELHQSTAMKQAATILRSKGSYRRNLSQDPFPILGTINSVRKLTFHYSIYPVTVYQIPWVPYASTQAEAYRLAYLYLQSMTYLPTQGILFPYYTENDMVFYLFKEGTIQYGSISDTVKMNYAYYDT